MSNSKTNHEGLNEMGNSKLKTSLKKSILSKVLTLLLVVLASFSFFAGCDAGLDASDSVVYDDSGNLRIEAPDLHYNYTSQNDDSNDLYLNSNLSGSISWNFSYYAANVFYPFADEQYTGTNFYKSSRALELLKKKTLSDNEKADLANLVYTGSATYDGNKWTDSNGNTLYRLAANESTIVFPSYEVVVDGTPITFYFHVKNNQNIYNDDGGIRTLNTDAIYFSSSAKANDGTVYPSEYIRVEKSTEKYAVNAVETDLPQERYIVVFNPKLRGNATTRSIKVRILAADKTNRGNSPYSSTLTYTAIKLAFSVYSLNSADDIKNVGYLTYNENAYYFNKISKTITPNPVDSKITYLEGYFPEGRIVNVERNLTENSDYALASFTTNKKATNSSALPQTLPTSISSYFNFIREEIKRTSIIENENAGAFNVASYYANQTNPRYITTEGYPENALWYSNKNSKVDSNNKNGYFFETLNIELENPENPNKNENTPLTLKNNEKAPSTITVVAGANLHGYTFYANYTKVKNFTQSGTVFAGDNFFVSSNDQFLTGYTISIYAIGIDRNSHQSESSYNYGVYATDATDIYQLTDTFNDNKPFTEIFTFSGGASGTPYTTIEFPKDFLPGSTTEHRTAKIEITIKGSSFTVTGLEHNMCLVFTKQDSENNIQYSFHNATMSSINFNGNITRSLFVQQADKVLCGVIGTEFEESSSIDVVVKQVTNNGTVDNLSNSDVPYEIIKSVTSKEDVHGYVTTNIILSIVVPENSLLTAYNLNTPEMAAQAKYTISGNQASATNAPAEIYYNATEDIYYAYTSSNVSISADKFDAAKRNIYYGEKVYTYSFRDSSYAGNTLTKNVYYNSLPDNEGNYTCIICKTTGSNQPTYELRNYSVVQLYYSTHPYSSMRLVQRTEDSSTVNYFETTTSEFLSSADKNSVVNYLAPTANIGPCSVNLWDAYAEGTTTVNSVQVPGRSIENGLLIVNDAGYKDDNPNELYYFSNRDADGQINGDKIIKYTLGEHTKTEASVEAVAYKSGLTYTATNSQEGNLEQEIYFYYDVNSIVFDGEPVYYYTAPIGRHDSENNVDAWFYKFDIEPLNSNIKLGSEIISGRGSNTNYENIYNIMGEKLVGFFYYYTAPVIKVENVQIRQYMGEEIVKTGLVLTCENNVSYVSNKEDPISITHNADEVFDYVNVLVNEGYNVNIEPKTTAAFRTVSINKKEYRIYFDPSNFTFKVQHEVINNDGTTKWENTNEFATIWDFTARNRFFDENANLITNDALSHNEYVFFFEDGSAASNFKNSGTYTCTGFTGGSTYQVVISYSAISLDDQTYVKVVYDGEWKLVDEHGNKNVIDNLSNYSIFPEIVVYNNNTTGKKAYLALEQSGSSNNNRKIINTENTTLVYNAYYYVKTSASDTAANTKVQLVASTQMGNTCTIEREAYTLDENNQKTQIMVWGKYIPTSNPEEPIVYPSFSNLIDDYDDAYEYIFGGKAFFYDIDYSSNKAIREGFIGVNYLSGSPYPNPVIYLSVRHKINEYSTIEIAVKIQEAFFVELMANELDNSSTSLIENFQTYSFKDTMANIDANDYIDNIYYILNRSNLSALYGFKIIDGEGSSKVIDAAFVGDTEKGKILKVNEVAVDEETGILYFTDRVNANGRYENIVYVETDYANKTIEIASRYFRPLKENECFAWRTSKKYIKEAGFFDVHGYTIDKLSGQVVFNSGELELNEVCKKLEGITLKSIYNQHNDYNYDEVIIAGTTTAYRTSYSVINYASKIDKYNEGLLGYSKATSIPILDSFDAKNTYFLKGKECAMFIADPLVQTEDGVSYRFLEWRVYSRYNSAVIYYDKYETEVNLGDLRFTNTMRFSPETAGYYIVLPVYQRIFNVSIATEVENGPQNQGGSVLVYYKNGQTSKLNEHTKTSVYSVEYLKTLLGAKYGYYYKDITFTAYAYFGDKTAEEIENECREKETTISASESLLQVFSFSGKNYGVFKGLDDEGNPTITIEEVYIASYSNNSSAHTAADMVSKKEDMKQVFELNAMADMYCLFTNINNAEGARIITNVAYKTTAKLSMPTVATNATTDIPFNIYEENGYLYVITGFNEESHLLEFDEESPIAKVYEKQINIVETYENITSLEYPGFYKSTDGQIMAGELAFDKNGNLETSLVYKTTYIDRESEVMIVALPDNGYRLLDWYDENGVKLSEKYGEDTKYYNEDDRIIKAYFENGKYYYYDNEVEAGASRLVPTNMLSKVRGYYVNTGTSVSKNYVEVFYSAAQEAYFYDSTLTIPVEDKYIYATINGQRKNLVEVLTHYEAALASGSPLNEDGRIPDGARYYLNNAEVYGVNTSRYPEFYRAYHTGNIVVSGNTLTIRSIHSNIKFVAVYREIYQAFILTDSEEDSGVEVVGVYYYSTLTNDDGSHKNTDNASIGRRINENGQTVSYENQDRITGKISDSRFTIFVEEDKTTTVVSSQTTIASLINHQTNGLFDGYIATQINKYGYNGNAYNYLTIGEVFGGQGLRQAVAAEGESLALTNLFFDTNTSVLVMVRTPATSPLTMHTLGLASENNLQPIIYPTQKYITENLTRQEYTSATASYADATNTQANYLYYVFELTLDRDPTNNYADLITHPTRSISTSLDILTGRYNNFYKDYFEIELSLDGVDNLGNAKTNSAYFKWDDYFTTNNAGGSTNNVETFTFKNQVGFNSTVIDALFDGLNYDETSKNRIKTDINAITNYQVKNISSFIEYLNNDVFRSKDKKILNITNARLNQAYLNGITAALDSITGTDEKSLALKANIQAEIDELKALGFAEEDPDDASKLVPVSLSKTESASNLISADVIYSSLNNILAKISVYLAETNATFIDSFWPGESPRTEENKNEILAAIAQRIRTIESSNLINKTELLEALENYYYRRYYAHEIVGDGSVNLINLTAIKLYTFSISSLTIDGYNADGTISYASEENSHPLGNSDGEFVFYTGVGTNGRTYIGNLVPNTSNAYYYNGTLDTRSNGVGIQLNNKYVDENPDYQEDKLENVHYVYKDFMLTNNSLLLIEGLKEEATKSGYQFMGWYQQKRIEKIPYRYFDLDGHLIKTINEEIGITFQPISYTSKVNGVLLTIADMKAPTDKDGNPIPLFVDENGYANVIAYYDKDGNPVYETRQIFYVDERTLDLYHYEQTTEKDENNNPICKFVKVDNKKYEYKEWSSMELVSTSYKYPYVAVANADTIITAIFKRIVDVNFSYNPLEASVNVSVSLDSENNPIVFTVMQNNTKLGDYTTKTDAHAAFESAYNADKTATYSITISGKFFVDATPTFIINPAGGYRLSCICSGGEEIKDIAVNEEDPANSITKIVYSNNMPEETINPIIVFDYTGNKFAENIVHSFDHTNLVGTIYATPILNNLKDYFETDEHDNITSVALSAEFKRVTLVYSEVDGFYKNEDGHCKPVSYDFVIGTGNEVYYKVNNRTYDELEKTYENVYFDSRYLIGDHTIFKAHTNSNEYGDIFDLLENDYISAGFIEDWIFEFCLYKAKVDYKKANSNITNINDIPEEKINEFKASILNSNGALNPLYNWLIEYFKPASSNMRYYLSLTDNNLVLYAYMDSDITDDEAIYVKTIADIETGEYSNFDHWYLNAQKPSTISGNSEHTLNDNVNFPTVHSIVFEYSENTGDTAQDAANADYNSKHALNKNNLVYFMRGIFEEDNKFEIGFAFANSITNTSYPTDFNTLVDMGVIASTDNAFDDLLSFTYTGIRYKNPTGTTEPNIDTTTSVPDSSDSTNGIITTKFHTGHYGTGTQFTISIANRFIVIKNSKAGYFEQNDVYAFVGYYVDGKIESTELSYTTTASSIQKIKVLFAKIVKVEIQNNEGGKTINMQNLTINGNTQIMKHYVTTCYGYYEDGGYNYAYCGTEIKIKFGVTPDNGYVLENVYYTNPNNSGEFLKLDNKNIGTTLTGGKIVNSFHLSFVCDSIVKLDIKEGINLKVDQLVFKNFYETTKGEKLTNNTLYKLYKIDENESQTEASTNVFAKGSKIKVAYKLNDDYSLIGFYINNQLINAANLFDETINGSANKTYTLILNENTSLEIRLVRNIKLSVNSVAGTNESNHTINNLTVSNKTTSTIVYNGTTPANNISFKAGEIINANITSYLDASFVGWYLKDNSGSNGNDRLISTSPNFDFTINSDEPYLNKTNNAATIVAKYAQTRTFIISKELERTAQTGANNNIYDLNITYTNKYGEEIATSLGSAASTTIEALVGSKLAIKASVSKDKTDAYYFEGFYTNGFVTSYDEDLEIDVKSSSPSTSATTIEANFLKGIIINIARRLNDNPYVGPTISVNANYIPTALTDGKTLSGTKAYMQIGLRESEQTNVASLIIKSEINTPENKEKQTTDLSSTLVFLGFYINNQPASSFAFCSLSGNELTINNAKSNFSALFAEGGLFENLPTTITIEARYASVAQITLRRMVDGKASTEENLQVSMLANVVSNTKTISAELTTLNSQAKVDVKNVYKYTTIALTASRFAGYEFVGFRVRYTGITNNYEYITKTIGITTENNIDDIIYYCLDDPYSNVGIYIANYEIEAYYTKSYNIVYVGTIMGGTNNTSVSFEETTSIGNINPTQVSNEKAEATTITLSSSAIGYTFLGYYDYSGKLITKDVETASGYNRASVKADNLISTIKNKDYENNQIFIEARYTKTVTITIERYDKYGNSVDADTNLTLPYGITTKINANNNNFKAWAIEQENDNRLFAYYSTAKDLEILPLEDKTYYALCDASVTIGSYGNTRDTAPIAVLGSSTSNGYITRGGYSSEIAGINIEETKTTFQAESYTIKYEDALKAGYVFIGWFGSAKYKQNTPDYIFPISNNLTLETESHLFNNIYAVFVEASATYVNLNADSHEGSYSSRVSVSSTYSSPYPMYVYNAENGSFELKTLTSGNIGKITTSINDDLYSCSTNGNDITTTRKNKEINLPYYEANGESRVAYFTDEIVLAKHFVTTIGDNKADDIKTLKCTLDHADDAAPKINVSTSANGNVDVYDGSLSKLILDNTDANELIFDNILIISTPNAGYYLDHYVVTRNYDYNTRISDLDYNPTITTNAPGNDKIYMPHFSLKVLDGTITITPVFKKNYNVNINKSVEGVTDKGSTNVYDTSSDGDKVTKQMDIVADRGYRIAGIVINNGSYSQAFNYGSNGSVNHVAGNTSVISIPNAYDTSEPDDANRTYLTKLSLAISSDEDVDISVIYNSVATLNVFDGRTLSTSKPYSAKVYIDATDNFPTKTLTTKPLIKQDIQTLIDGNTKLRNQFAPKTNPQQTLVGYYYNNKAIDATSGIDISGNHVYDIIATYANSYTLSVSFVLVDENGNAINNNGTNNSVYNTPMDDFSMSVTRLVNPDGEATDVETSILLEDDITNLAVFNSATLEFNDNDSLVVLASSNRYFTFVGWFKGNSAISGATNPAININSYIGGANGTFNTLIAKYKEETRTMVVKQNYMKNTNDDGYTPSDNLYISADNASWTTKLNDVADDISGHYVFNIGDRNIVVRRNNIGTKVYFNIKYSVASCDNNDIFYIKDTSFTQMLGKYEYTNDEGKLYVFNNITQINDNVIRTTGGDYTPGEPMGKINLEDFFINQDLNFNVYNMHNLQYTLLISGDNIDELNSIVLKVYQNGTQTDAVDCSSFTATTTYDQAIINIWVQEGTLVTITATPTEGFSSIGESSTNPETHELMPILDKEMGYANFNYTTKPLISNVTLTGLDFTSDTEEYRYFTRYFKNLYMRFNEVYGSDTDTKVASINAYSFVINNDAYFVADYVPIFKGIQQYINGALASTDLLSILNIQSGTNKNGNTFAFTSVPTTTPVGIKFESNASTILDLLDKNNNLINTNTANGLTTYSKDDSNTSDYQEMFNISTKQTEDPTIIQGSENGLSVISERLADITIKAGYFDAMPNYLNNYNTYQFNKYKTLYDYDLPIYLSELEAYESIEDKEGLTAPTISYNDLITGITTTGINSETISGYETEYTDSEGNNIIIDSMTKANIKVGKQVYIKTKVNDDNTSNYFFKGFVIINSASKGNVNTFISGEMQEDLSSLDSYKIITREDVGEMVGGYYQFPITLAGDTVVVAMYEKIILQVDVRIKELPEEIKAKYQTLLNAYSDNRDALNNETIIDSSIDVLLNKNSDAGKLASNSQLLVPYNSQAIITTINYTFTSLAGYSAARTYGDTKYISEGGESKTSEQVPELFKNAEAPASEDEENNKPVAFKLTSRMLQLVNPEKARQNLYINHVTQNMIIGAYFTALSYTISITIEETELMPVIDNNGYTRQVGYIYLKEYDAANDDYNLEEILTIKDEYFEAEFDASGNITNLTDKDHTLLRLSPIRQDLISPEQSLSVPAEDGEYYLRYRTNKFVIGAFKGNDGNYTYSRIKIIIEKHPTDDLDEDGNVITKELDKATILKNNLFFKETNISLAGSHTPQNSAIYFTSTSGLGGTIINNVLPGLITVSLNNKRAVDINDLNNVNIVPINTNGEVMIYEDGKYKNVNGKELTNTIIANYRIDLLVTANGANGFPSVKIKMNSPNGDETIIPYTYDNTSYLTKLQKLTSTKTSSELSIWANPQNLDMNFISGFYNEVYKNTTQFTDKNYKQDVLDFDLTLVFAKLSTNVKATVEIEDQSGGVKSYTITDKKDSKVYYYNPSSSTSNSTQTLKSPAIEKVLNEVVRYELFVLSNGAYFQNKVFDWFAVLEKENNSDHKIKFNSAMQLLDFMNNFARADFFKNNVKNEYQFFVPVDNPNRFNDDTFALLNSYYGFDHNNTDQINLFNSVIDGMHNDKIIPESFTLETLFNVRRENILGYYTGLELDEDALTNCFVTHKGTKVDMGSTNDGYYGANHFKSITNTLGESTKQTFTYDTNSSSNFNEFYINSGDMCIMVSELAQKYQSQQNIEYNKNGSVKKAIQAYLYYNECSMFFNEEKSLGRFTYTFKNTSPNDEALDTNKKIDSWSTLSRTLTAIFNKTHEFDGTYTSVLVTTASPTGVHITNLGTTGLKSVLYVYNANSTDSSHRLPIIKLNGWEGGEMPSDQWWANFWTITGISAIVIGIVAVTIITCGSAAAGAGVAGATGIAKLFAIAKVVAVVAGKALIIVAAGAAIGVTMMTILSDLTEPLFNINWGYLNKITP